MKRLALGVVILGAGASTRMGRAKLLLPWGQTTIIGHLIQQWRSAGGEQIAVVCRLGDRLLADELDRLNFSACDRIANPQPERGMFSSVQCAANWGGWRDGLATWAIVLGDQPHLRLETLTTLLAFQVSHRKAVCQPAYKGHGKHPVLMPRDVFAELRTTPANTLKEFLQQSAFTHMACEIDDSGLNFDLDHPEDYAIAMTGIV